MSTTSFEIKVVYDGSKRGRAGAVVHTGPRAGFRAAGPGRRPGAWLNLAVAAVLYYVIWWHADPFLHITMLMKTPIHVPPEFANNPFFGSPPPRPAPEEPEAALQPAPATPALRWTGKTAQWLIPATGYAWITLATMGTCAVALAGGAGLGAFRSAAPRIFGFAAMFILAAALAFAAYKIWAEYKTMYKVQHLRWGMGGLVLFCALWGLAFRRARRVTLFASLMLLLAASGTAAGLWVWSNTGAIEPRFATWPMLGAAFLIHGAWAGVMLISAARMRG